MSKPYGWDERDYKLASQLKCLPSYGLLGNGDYMVSLEQVIRVIENQAEVRGNEKMKKAGMS